VGAHVDGSNLSPPPFTGIWQAEPALGEGSYPSCAGIDTLACSLSECSSVGELPYRTREVGGSNPSAPTGTGTRGAGRGYFDESETRPRPLLPRGPFRSWGE
jgi:hypothetical protein